MDHLWKSTLLYLPEFPGSKAQNASSSPWLSPELPQGMHACVCAMLTDQSLLCQQPRPADLKPCHQLQQDRGGTSAITLGLTTTISEQAVGAVRKSFNFTNFGLQAVSIRNEGRTNWMTEWQEPENQHSPPPNFKQK